MFPERPGGMYVVSYKMETVSGSGETKELWTAEVTRPNGTRSGPLRAGTKDQVLDKANAVIDESENQ